MPASAESEVRALYQQLLQGWNQRSAQGMAEPFAKDAELIGFDGSLMAGRAELVSQLQQIFAHHPTGVYVSKVQSVRPVGPETVILRAIAGMVPAGRSDLEPALNAVQTVVAVQIEGQWRIALFQNTPAQLHGRPELVQQMTEELRQLLP